MRLADKVALVTGGGAGLGLAITERFAAEGAHVYITGRRKEVLDDAAASIEGRVTPVAADSTSSSDLEELAETIRSGSGRLDVLVADARMIELAGVNAHRVEIKARFSGRFPGQVSRSQPGQASPSRAQSPVKPRAPSPEREAP